MSLEEELKQLEEIKTSNMVEEKNYSELFKTLTPEQQAQIFNLVNTSKEEIEVKTREDNTEIINDYKENFVYPSLESPFDDVDNSSQEYMKRINDSKQEPTELSKAFDSAFNNIVDELDLDINYRAIVSDIKLFHGDNKGKYDSIVIHYDVEDNGLIKNATDYYRFNWEYQEISINKLVSFLKSIEGFYKDDFRVYTVEGIQEELKFLIGAHVNLKQIENKAGYRENIVKVLGSFDRINRRIVDR